METIGSALILIGFIGSVIASIWLLIEAFGQGILWGLGIIFLPFVAFIFLIVHWDNAKRPFFLQLMSALPAILGVMLAG